MEQIVPDLFSLCKNILELIFQERHGIRNIQELESVMKKLCREILYYMRDM